MRYICVTSNDCDINRRSKYILGPTHSLSIKKGKVKSHSHLAVGAVNVRVPHVSMGMACEGWCLSALPSLPKPSPALKKVGHPFAAGRTKSFQLTS